MNTEDKLLGREDLLKTYLIYVKQHGKSRDVLKARLDAILRAYNPNWGMNQSQDFPYGILIDKECSEEKLNEITEELGHLRNVFDAPEFKNARNSDKSHMLTEIINSAFRSASLNGVKNFIIEISFMQ